MSLVLLLALSLQDPQAPRTVTDIQARIPKTFVVVSLQLAKWQEDHPKDHPLGDKLLMAGTIAPDESILSLIVEPNSPPVSPQTWRQRLAPGGKPFDVGATPCTDTSQELAPGMTMTDYHAFFATRTHSLDLHISGTPGAANGFPRAEFERIVKSLHVLLLRRGWTEDYPEALAAPMTVAAVLGVDQKEWREGYLVKHPDDWAAHFVNAEYLHESKAALDQQLAAYDRALALAGKIASPDAKTKFAIAMLNEGKSLALLDGKRVADAFPPLEKACAIVEELKHEERGGLQYNLACAHALCRHEGPALSALAKAIEAAPRYREVAAKDADFAAIAKSAAFKKLVAAPGEPAPKKE